MFARIKSPSIDLINNADAAWQSDGRLQAMQGMAAGANAYQAASAIASITNGAGSSEWRGKWRSTSSRSVRHASVAPG